MGARARPPWPRRPGLSLFRSRSVRAEGSNVGQRPVRVSALERDLECAHNVAHPRHPSRGPPAIRAGAGLARGPVTTFEAYRGRGR